ncbi:hypothetical protein C8R45DRAFT_1112259 [Mycena sanguinolenta]|nr:hypothetical protein C8R45DRAFT_1112259 [Mycena sanguinolenta]
MISEPELPPHRFRTIPCTGVDLSFRHLVVTIGLVIDAQLEANRLEGTLWKLIEHKFPRAGARLSFRNGVYELQIPEQFDSHTPPFIFTVQEHSEMYHGDGRPEIPNALTGSEPCVTPDPGLERFLHSPTCPKTLNEFVQSNSPLLHIHVSVFKDITFLGFIASHMAFDAVGAGTLLSAWTRLLRGEDMDTISGMEWDTQPFTPFESGPVNPGIQRGWFTAGPPKDEVSPGESDVEDIRRFTVYDHRMPTDHTPIHVHVVRNLRGYPVFANDAPLKDPYIHNTISTIPIPPIPASAFQTEPLGMLALRIRRSILAYNADPEAISAALRWRCAEANRLELLCPCPPGTEYSYQTDWRAAKLGELDFTGAVAGNEHMKTAARVVFVYPLLCTVAKPWRRGVNRVLMDDADPVWMCETRGEDDWDSIRQAGGVTFTD